MHFDVFHYKTSQLRRKSDANLLCKYHCCIEGRRVVKKIKTSYLKKFAISDHDLIFIDLSLFNTAYEYECTRKVISKEWKVIKWFFWWRNKLIRSKRFWRIEKFINLRLSKTVLIELFHFFIRKNDCMTSYSLVGSIKMAFITS